MYQRSTFQGVVSPEQHSKNVMNFECDCLFFGSAEHFSDVASIPSLHKEPSINNLAQHLEFKTECCANLGNFLLAVKLLVL